MAALRHVQLLLPDLRAALRFYGDGLGLRVLASEAEQGWAELDAGPTTLHLQQTESLAQATTGYSPFLNFTVPDLDSAVAACLQAGGTLDGPIKYPIYGKIASMRCPAGQMVGLFEPV